MLSGRGLCDELITRPEESYRLCCVVMCDLETSRIGAPYIYIYIYDISRLRVKPNMGKKLSVIKTLALIHIMVHNLLMYNSKLLCCSHGLYQNVSCKILFPVS